MSPLKVKKYPKESSHSIVARFTQKLKRSGILLEARKKRFRQRSKSRQMKKYSAIFRHQKKKEFEKMKKSGKA